MPICPFSITQSSINMRARKIQRSCVSISLIYFTENLILALCTFLLRSPFVVKFSSKFSWKSPAFQTEATFPSATKMEQDWASADCIWNRVPKNIQRNRRQKGRDERTPRLSSSSIRSSQSVDDNVFRCDLLHQPTRQIAKLVYWSYNRMAKTEAEQNEIERLHERQPKLSVSFAVFYILNLWFLIPFSGPFQPWAFLPFLSIHPSPWELLYQREESRYQLLSSREVVLAEWKFHRSRIVLLELPEVVGREVAEMRTERALLAREKIEGEAPVEMREIKEFSSSLFPEGWSLFHRAPVLLSDSWI